MTAPTSHRRQLGNLECNIDRGEIVFHVAQLARTANALGNATDLMAAYECFAFLAHCCFTDCLIVTLLPTLT